MRSLLAAALIASPVWAGEDFGDSDLFGMDFVSPSGNIACMAFAPDWLGPGYMLRCDVHEHRPSWDTAPAGCDLDWSGILILGETGPGERGCAGDTIRTADPLVLDYGQSVSFGTITCRSERAGMTCTNAGGHGIFLSRAEQRVF